VNISVSDCIFTYTSYCCTHRDFISAAQRYTEAQKGTEALPLGVNGLLTLAQSQDQADKSLNRMDPTEIQSFTACGVSRDTIDEAPLSPPAAPPSPPSFYVSPGFSSAVFEEDDPTVTPKKAANERGDVGGHKPPPQFLEHTVALHTK
jgi:hypothetical protein